jgi:hypothetical protein
MRQRESKPPTSGKHGLQEKLDELKSDERVAEWMDGCWTEMDSAWMDGSRALYGMGRRWQQRLFQNKGQIAQIYARLQHRNQALTAPGAVIPSSNITCGLVQSIATHRGWVKSSTFARAVRNGGEGQKQEGRSTEHP